MNKDSLDYNNLSGMKESLLVKKLPMYTVIIKQFPLALQQIANRSIYGHKKYELYDHDWMNFKRVPDAVNEYQEATIRHLMNIGPETPYEHLIAAAWNLLAIIQIKEEEIIEHKEKENASRNKQQQNIMEQ
jgi:hypothetical protein